ncbi:MAG: tyrosine--tRNA ligase [Myxococcota bacterium]
MRRVAIVVINILGPTTTPESNEPTLGKTMANVFDTLRDRGFIQQSTDEDAVRTAFDGGSVVAYVGYDPTADSLHVGHLFTLMALTHLERAGHQPVIVLGGGTAMVGDPSGKTEMRQMISKEAIETNVEAIRAQIASLLDVGGRTRVVNNAEWLLELNYVEFLRDIGRHFSVNKMLAAEAYKRRLEKGLSFIEFSYQLFQAYDFLELSRRYDCTLQMGGDDQWGNILAGVDLVRRLERKQVQGLTFPLLTTATGEKMGKTASGAVWLSTERLPVYDYYQYWVNAHDDDVVKLLKIFTYLPVDQIESVAGLTGSELNAAKSVLAYEATRVVHGEAAAEEAHRAALGAFGGRTIDPSILPASSLPRSASGDASAIPTTAVSLPSATEGLPLAELMVTGGLADSKSAARRLIKQGAVKLDDVKVTNEQHRVAAGDLEGEPLTVRAGKKKVHRFTLGS